MGRDVDLGRDLAVKVLLDSHKDKPELIRRFIEEAQIGGSCNTRAWCRSTSWARSPTGVRSSR